MLLTFEQLVGSSHDTAVCVSLRHFGWADALQACDYGSRRRAITHQAVGSRGEEGSRVSSDLKASKELS